MCDDGNSLGDGLGFTQNGLEFTRGAINKKFMCNRCQVIGLNACQRGGSDFQALNHIAFDQVFIDDFIDIVFIDVGIPRFFRVNDDDRSLVATIQATGVVDADFFLAAQLQRFNALLGVIAQFLRTEIVATFGAALTLVGAEKDVILVITHECSKKEFERA